MPLAATLLPRKLSDLFNLYFSLFLVAMSREENKKGLICRVLRSTACCCFNYFSVPCVYYCGVPWFPFYFQCICFSSGFFLWDPSLPDRLPFHFSTGLFFLLWFIYITLRIQPLDPQNVPFVFIGERFRETRLSVAKY